MNRAKRNYDGNDDDQPERKRPALASVIVEALKLDSLQKLCSSLEPILRRVVSEEVERALAKVGPARITGSSRSCPKRIEGLNGRNLQLHFRSRLSLPLFTGGRVEGEQGASIHVVLIDANNGHAVTFGSEASTKLDVVVLEGDFNNEDDEDWTQEEFESHIVKEREGKRPLLTGDLQISLNEGVGTLGEVIFTDNSSWIRSRKFRLGLKVSSGFCEGIRIREAKTEAFIVKDHRGELYKKHYPPGLNDEVWRLEKIAKDGAFHKKLNASGILIVEDFLRCLVRDSTKLRSILGSGMSNKMWDALVEHAKTCVLSGKLYIYYAEDSRNVVGVVFNNIYELSGLISEDQYFSADLLSDSQKVYVDGLVKKAYENWNLVIEYDGQSLMNLKQPKKAPANYSTTIDHPIQFHDELPADQSSVHSELAIRGFHQNQHQLLTSDPCGQCEIASCTQHDQFMENIHQSQSSVTNVAGMGLGPPQWSTGISSSVQPTNQYLFEEKGSDDLLSEEEIRLRSHEMLENEDMQQLLRLFSMGGDEGFGLQSPMQSFDEDRGRAGKAVVGWLKIKAAMRWGFFIRRKAAERRAQIVDLQDQV